MDIKYINADQLLSRNPTIATNQEQATVNSHLKYLGAAKTLLEAAPANYFAKPLFGQVKSIKDLSANRVDPLMLPAYYSVIQNQTMLMLKSLEALIRQSITEVCPKEQANKSSKYVFELHAPIGSKLSQSCNGRAIRSCEVEVVDKRGSTNDTEIEIKSIKFNDLCNGNNSSSRKSALRLKTDTDGTRSISALFWGPPGDDFAANIEIKEPPNTNHNYLRVNNGDMQEVLKPKH